MIEKRSKPRLMKQTLLSYDVVRDDAVIGDEGLARTLDMSSAGMHLELPKSVDRGDQLTLTLNMDGQMVTVTGSVVWVTPGKPFDQAGIKVRPDQKQYIQWLRCVPND